MGRKRLIGCVVLAVTCAGTPVGVWSAPPAGVTAAGKGPTSAPAARAKASLEPLIQSGLDALAAGQVQAAREAFQDAITIDPRNAKAHHGLAMCFLESKELPKAKDAIEKALTNTPKPDRSLALNGAALALQTKNTMRAAKLAKDYLSANPKELDEVMVNALGTALDKATAAERKNRFFTECASFYEIANKKLEGARPGYKRFGVEWLPAAEADKKLAAVAAQQKQLDSLQDGIVVAEERFRAAEKEFERQKFLLTRGETPGNYYYQQAEYNYDQTKKRLDTAKESYEKVVASLERPKFASDIATVAIDDRTVPGLSAPTAVAMNLGGGGTTGSGGSGFEVKPKTTSTKPPKPKSTGKELTDDDMAGKTGTGTIGGSGETAVPVEPAKPRKLRITQYAAAFPVGPDRVVTSAAAIADGATLRLQASDGTSLEAEVVKKDEETGLALLKVTGRTLAALPMADAFNGGAVTCPSFPTVDLFSPAAQSIAGTSQAPKAEGWTVSLNLHPRLAGAPLISGGKVVGVCVAPRDAEKAKLPAVTLERLKAFVGDDVKAGARIGDPVASLLQLVTTRESMTGE